jgi:hypothetical protein
MTSRLDRTTARSRGATLGSSDAIEISALEPSLDGEE